MHKVFVDLLYIKAIGSTKLFKVIFRGLQFDAISRSYTDVEL